jgi:hypothetical protein
VIRWKGQTGREIKPRRAGEEGRSIASQQQQQQEGRQTALTAQSLVLCGDGVAPGKQERTIRSTVIIPGGIRSRVARPAGGGPPMYVDVDYCMGSMLIMIVSWNVEEPVLGMGEDGDQDQGARGSKPSRNDVHNDGSLRFARGGDQRLAVCGHQDTEVPT